MLCLQTSGEDKTPAGTPQTLKTLIFVVGSCGWKAVFWTPGRGSGSNNTNCSGASNNRVAGGLPTGYLRHCFTILVQSDRQTDRQTDKAAVSGQFDSCVRRHLVSFKKCEHVSHKI